MDDALWVQVRDIRCVPIGPLLRTCCRAKLVTRQWLVKTDRPVTTAESLLTKMSKVLKSRRSRPTKTRRRASRLTTRWLLTRWFLTRKAPVASRHCLALARPPCLPTATMLRQACLLLQCLHQSRPSARSRSVSLSIAFSDMLKHRSSPRRCSAAKAAQKTTRIAADRALVFAAGSTAPPALPSVKRRLTARSVFFRHSLFLRRVLKD
jgi:hypothetical protein